MREPRRDARLLVVEPVGSSLAVLDAARELGVEVVVATFDQGDRTLSAALRDRTDHLLRVDTNDEAALTDAVLELHAEHPVTAVVPGFEFYVDTAARLAARLGVRGLAVDAARRLRDKSLMRDALDAAGLRVPRYARAGNGAELEAAARLVGFPAVLKPTRSAGSVHVSRVNSLAELHAAYAWMRQDPRTDLGRGLDGRVLLEEYLAGPEVSVEGYVVDDEVVIVSVTAKELGPEPSFVEVGHTVGTELDPEVRAAIESYVADVCRALGVTFGPFHGELRLPDGRPVLIEMAARLAGDHICDLIALATGTSLPRIMLASYLSLPPEQVAAAVAPAVKCAAIHFFTAPELTTLTRVEGWDSLLRSEGVLEAELYLAPGDAVPPLEDFRGRLGHVVFTADSVAEAQQRRAVLAGAVRFE
ncbi:ATP-grasp domain-containing protein [Streptacidiphilus rugosus]|uniref:ATP-grasp domain-containing protein n=1 Tax=Streptacidiphilus rugosus TaxID=405783 RepID=UPI00068DC9F5|nr:ATP-grasp domain-containing protein [Streptacidiphilus rugosus]